MRSTSINTVRNRLLRGSVGGSIVRVAGLGTSFLLQVALARAMNVEDFGLCIYVLAWVNFAALLAKVGMDTAALRFVPEYESTGTRGAIRSFHRYGLKISLRNGLVLGALLTTVGLLSSETSGRVFWFAAMLLVPLNALSNVSGGVIHGLGRVVESQAAQQVLKPGLVLVAVAGLVVTSGLQLAPWEVYAFHGVAALTVAALLFSRVRALVPSGPTLPGDAREQAKMWRAVAMPMLFISGANMVIAQCDVAMLGALSTSTEAGLYAVASKVAGLVVLGLTAVNAVAAPMLAGFHASGDRGMLQHTLRQAALGIFFSTAVLAALAFAFSDTLLGLFGPEYKASEHTLRVLLVANVVNASAGSVGYLMTMTGNQRAAASILGGVAAINIAANAILIPLYGAYGAAYATAFSIVVWNALMYAFCRGRLGFDPSILSIFRANV